VAVIIAVAVAAMRTLLRNTTEVMEVTAVVGVMALAIEVMVQPTVEVIELTVEVIELTVEVIELTVEVTTDVMVAMGAIQGEYIRAREAMVGVVKQVMVEATEELVEATEELVEAMEEVAEVMEVEEKVGTEVMEVIKVKEVVDHWLNPQD